MIEEQRVKEDTFVFVGMMMEKYKTKRCTGRFIMKLINEVVHDL